MKGLSLRQRRFIRKMTKGHGLTMKGSCSVSALKGDYIFVGSDGKIYKVDLKQTTAGAI